MKSVKLPHPSFRQILQLFFILSIVLLSINSWTLQTPSTAISNNKWFRTTTTSTSTLHKFSDLTRRVGGARYILNRPHHLFMSSVEKTADSTTAAAAPSQLLSPTKSSPITSIPLPIHPELVQGKLENGFTYLILPNKVPPGRFEAHLEVLSGSVNELTQQQGMAHLLEHVAYMGSPKRQLIAGTGSRTNAYTDFHHTVFFAACPTQTPDQFWKKPMLPMALDALLDVMITEIEDDRLEKERAAVLSEASMVNKMEYRVECQILSTLHAENRLSQRFPIGKEHLIKAWTKSDLQFYHSLHYRPDNVILFLVGDVEVQNAISLIQQKFGHLTAKVDSEKVFKESKEFPAISMRKVNRHFPPVTHKWSCTEDKLQHYLPEDLIKPAHHLAPPTSTSFTAPPPSAATVPAENPPLESKDERNGSAILANTRIFQHELLQSFSFHLFAKRPIEPTTTEFALKREVMKRMVLSALLIRLNVQQRSETLFTLADFNQMNWVREGCAVCSLDLTTDIGKWQRAIALAIQEIRRMGLYGVTQSELVRYKQSILSEAMQMAVQSNQLSHEDLLNELMECEACGHSYMHPIERFQVIERLLGEVTLEEVNAVAKELCEHLSHLDVKQGIQPAAIIACAPMIDRQGASFTLTDEEVNKVVITALSAPIEPLQETKVPETLLPETYLQEQQKFYQPRYVPLEGKASLRENPVNKNSNQLGVSQKRLANGVKVNLKSLNTEPQELHMRVYIPGGRIVENRSQPGSMLLGARTLQEGGAFSKMSREEVELFCIDHAVGVEIKATQEALILDFHASTMLGKGRNVSGAEAIFQVAHIILTDFKWEEDAFERAKQSYQEEFDSIIKGLETACQESLKYSLTQGDGRYLTPNHKQLELLNLDIVKNAISRQLTPSNVEVSISGDLPIPTIEELVLKYFGTVPPKRSYSSTAQAGSSTGASIAPLETVDFPSDALTVRALGKKQQLGVYLPDSDERAMGYLAGAAPNLWGVYSKGETISSVMAQKTGKDEERRKHPLFGYVVLAIVQEVANRRLFSVVREEKQLTYDASFNFEGNEAIAGGYYMVSVTSSPDKVQSAIRACKVALQSLKGSFGVMGDSVQSAKRSILSKFKAESLTNKFWVEHLAGTQIDHIPFKTLKAILDFENVVNSVTVQDIQLLIELLQFEEENMTVCVGIAAPEPPAEMAGNPKIAGVAKNATASPQHAPAPASSTQPVGRISTATQLS